MRQPLLIAHLLDYFFPPRCLLCTERIERQAGVLICSSCLSAITCIESSSCPRCGKPFLTENGDDHWCGACLESESLLTIVRALGRYEDRMRSLIHLIKYKQTFAAISVIGYLLDRHTRWDAELAAHDIIVPVPLHKRRLRQRGFNQAVHWGALVSKKYRIPLARQLLERTKWTTPQVTLRGDRRKTNVRNAFRVLESSNVRHASVLLVDDVYTTGATVQECARMLQKAGAFRVDGFVIARAV